MSLKQAILCLVIVMAFVEAASAREVLSLNTVLTETEKTSPQVMAARYRTAAAQEQIRMAKSSYMPSLDAAAIATDGSPGAFSLLGVDSNIGSSERIGTGGALILKQDIWDFGRTGNAVESAKAQAEVQEKQQSVTRAQVDMQVLGTYFNCVFMKSQVEDSQLIAKEAQYMAQETDKFVRSGQRSIVERYLIDAQAKEAQTRVAELEEREKVITQRLGIELGRADIQGLDCPDLSQKQHEDSISLLENKNQINPFLEVKKSQVKASEAELGRAKAGRMPELLGLVTGGYFQNDQLDQKWNYSAGIGISLPLFEGFKIDADISRASADLESEKAGYQATVQSVNISNARYDEQIRALRVRLDYLQKENKLAHDAYLVAKKRYFGLQGGLIDLREALRNLERVLSQIDEAQRDLFIARGGRALFNGVKVSE